MELEEPAKLQQDPQYRGLDEDKADNSALDITVANVYDDTTVEQDSDYDDDDY